MIPKKVNIAGIDYKIILESEGRLKEAMKQLRVKDWESRYSYWDPVDTCIYISEDLPDQLKEFYFCLEVFRAWSFYIGDKLWENDRIIRPYAVQLRLFLKSFQNKRKKGLKYIH